MEINYKTDKVVSFSQYSTYKSCPHKWYLEYVKGYRDEKPNMYFVFGTAIHEALQYCASWTAYWRRARVSTCAGTIAPEGHCQH